MVISDPDVYDVPPGLSAVGEGAFGVARAATHRSSGTPVIAKVPCAVQWMCLRFFETVAESTLESV